MKTLISAFILIVTSCQLIAQDSISVRHLFDTEQKLKGYFTQLYDTSSSEVKDSLNDMILNSFKKELSTWDGFYYQWKDLDMIGKVASEDKKLKIFSWYVKYDEAYIYYALLAFENGDRGKEDFTVISLVDRSEEIKEPEKKVLAPNNWFGAVYFKLKTYSYRRDKWYALIGFDFNDIYSNKKILEILKINNKGRVQFGGEIKKDGKEFKRLIFEYSSEVVMSVNFDERLDMIVYDHLRPFEPLFEGNFRFYAPDGSYDGLRFEKGDFIQEEDIDARNY